MSRKELTQQEKLLKSIKLSIKGASYASIKLSEIDPDLTIDIRVDRDTEKDSQEVMKSVNRDFYGEISMLIVMKIENRDEYPIKDGTSYVIIDGKTRYIELSKIDQNAVVFACILPELKPDQQMYLNAIINSKRANLSDYSRMVVVKKFIDNGFSIEETSDILGFSTKDIEQKNEISLYPEEAKQKFEEGKISSRKLEEGVGFVYSKPEIIKITSTIEGKKYVDDCVNSQVDKLIRMNLKRDSMSVDKLDEKLYKHILIGKENNLSPKDVADASIPTINEIYSSTATTLVCEHPTKIEAVEKFMKETKPEFLVNLFCDPTVYDGKTNLQVKSIIERGVDFLGAKNCVGVAHFETNHKIEYMKKIGFDVIKDGTKSDVYCWLSKQPVKHGKGLIVVDSYGSSKHNSISFINYLKSKFPESTILFLILDQFNNYRNAGEAFVPTYTIMNWGIDPVSSVPEFAKKMNYDIIWDETAEVNETDDGNVDNVTVDGRKKKRAIYLLKA